MLRNCDGTGTGKSYPFMECVPCKRCPPGSYRVGCNVPGTGESNSTHDDVQCLPCSPCADGQYIDPSRECDGASFSPKDRACIDCPRCAQGQYYASGCTGTQRTDAHTCANCLSSCARGEYIERGCNGSTSRSTPELCRACPSCSSSSSAGSTCSSTSYALYCYASVPCSGTKTRYEAYAGDQTCSRCTCPIGYTIHVPCSGTNNHVCRGPEGQIYYPPGSSSF
jgi:hypothetical protein